MGRQRHTAPTSCTALTVPPLVMFLSLRCRPRPLAHAESDPCLPSERQLKLLWRSLRPPDPPQGHGQVQHPSQDDPCWPSFLKRVSMSAYDWPHKTMAKPFASYSLACNSEGLSTLAKDTVACLLTHKCKAQEGTSGSPVLLRVLSTGSPSMPLKQHSLIVS